MTTRLRALCYRLTALALLSLALSVWRDFGWVGFSLENTRAVVLCGLWAACACPAIVSGVRLGDDDAWPLSVSRVRLLVMGGVSVGLALWEDYDWAGLENMPYTVASVQMTLYLAAAGFAGASVRWVFPGRPEGASR